MFGLFSCDVVYFKVSTYQYNKKDEKKKKPTLRAWDALHLKPPSTTTAAAADGGDNGGAGAATADGADGGGATLSSLNY